MKKLDLSEAGALGLIKISTKAAALLAVMSFLFGSIFWAAVDIFALYSENQFTGRMRSFDIEYWDSIKGTAFVLLTASLANVIGSRATSMITGEKKGK
jgi:hypothetical protein